MHRYRLFICCALLICSYVSHATRSELGDEFVLVEDVITHMEVLPWCQSVIAANSAGNLLLLQLDGTVRYEIPQKKMQTSAASCSVQQPKVDADCARYTIPSANPRKPAVRFLRNLVEGRILGFAVGYEDGSLSIFKLAFNRWEEESDAVSPGTYPLTVLAVIPGEGFCSGNGGGLYHLRPPDILTGAFAPAHSKGITAMLYDPESRILFTASESLTLKLFHFEGMYRPLSLVAQVGGKMGVIMPRGAFHHDYIAAMAFLKPGVLVTGPVAGSIRLWHFTRDNIGFIRKLPKVHGSAILQLLAKPTGREGVWLLLALDKKGILYAWRLQESDEGKIFTIQERHSGQLGKHITAIALTSKEGVVLCAHADGTFEQVRIPDYQ